MSWRTPMILEFNTINGTLKLPIYDVSGTYRVDWGDGSVNTEYTSITPSITSEATNPIVKIQVKDDGSKIGIFGNSNSDWPGHDKLTTITQWGDFNGLTAINRLGDASLNEVPNYLPSTVMDMAFMFNNASNFNQDISMWNVSKIKNMHQLFFGATSFNKYIGGWDVGDVTDMVCMFHSATAFNQDIGNWDVRNVKSMSYMFHSATAFNQYIGAWNVRNVTTMEYMFHNATAFNQYIGA